ncbi:MAG: hypothetical protein ABI706_18685 [Ilumatobacteraceae bacterium]
MSFTIQIGSTRRREFYRTGQSVAPASVAVFECVIRELSHDHIDDVATRPDTTLAADHRYNRQVESSKGLVAADGMELGLHFDNSSFAVTMLLRAPQGGGQFEHVSAVRYADAGDMAFEGVGRILDGDKPVHTLAFEPGDLVLFRGRDVIHGATPTVGDTTRLLVVFAYNDQPGVAPSGSAPTTFSGRTA